MIVAVVVVDMVVAGVDCRRFEIVAKTADVHDLVANVVAVVVVVVVVVVVRKAHFLWV